MSLVATLTPERLARLADWGYERGVRYFEQQRVARWSASDTAVEGVVVGGAEYVVRLFTNGKQLGYDCTCPVGGRGQACKHVVALGLTYLADLQPSQARVERPTFATRDELDAFAREHHVEHELLASAHVLIPQLGDDAGTRWVLGRLSLADIGSLEGAVRYLGARRLARLAAEAVHERLHEAAEDVVAGVAAEVTRLPTTPLTSRLAPIRAAVREAAWPRASATGELVIESATGTAVWREAASLPGAARLEARLRLVPRTVLACTCKASACTHLLALIDRLLADDDPAIATELLRPAWQRALAVLDVEVRAKPRVEVWWKIEEDLHAPTLVAIVRKEKKRGGTTSGARIAPDRLLADHADELSEQDVRIAEHLAAWRYGGGASPTRAFAALAGHPRVLLGDDPISVRRVPLAFIAHAIDDSLRLEPAIAGARVSPRLLAPLLELYAPGEPLILVEPEHARCLLVDVTPEARRLWDALARHGDTFPPESHGPLLERISALEGRVQVEVPERVKGAQLARDLVVVARVRVVGATLELEALVRPCAGAPLFAPGAGPRDVLVVRDGQRGYVQRALGDELAHVRQMLARLPLAEAAEGPPLCFSSEGDDALALVEALADPPEGIEAQWIDARPQILSSPTPDHVRVKIDRKRDWFGMDGDVKLDHARIELAVVLDAIRRQQRFVRVDDRRWVELSEMLRARLQPLADAAFHGKHGMELSPAAADALARSGIAIEAAPAWRELADKAARARRLRPKPPAELEGTLRPYQQEGHAWLARLAAWGTGACLADDMGLGKTIQAIALLLDRASKGPALVIAPTSVTLNWVDELRRFAPTLNPIVYAEQRTAEVGRRDVLIASYGLLVRDVDKLAATRFETLVLDEAQVLKNATTQRAKAARALDAGFRLAMSGTPFENHVGELWSVFSVAFPGLLGSWEQFRDRFAIPIDRDRDAVASASLSRLIRPFLLRRTKAEVARELPPRTEIAVPVALSDDEARLYEDARLAAVAHLAKETKKLRDEQRRFQVLAALTRLRLLASHPKLYDAASPVASSKMARLLELVDELRAEGHRALVFSQFTSHLALVRAELDRAGISYLYLDGATATRERARLVDEFQRGAADVFLISLKAGGTGINLTGADYVIHLDPWWNPAVEDQATDRAHRIGQRRPVTVYRLISRDTVEERILEMHADKRALVTSILDGTSAAGKLSTKDLLALIGEVAAR